MEQCLLTWLGQLKLTELLDKNMAVCPGQTMWQFEISCWECNQVYSLRQDNLELKTAINIIKVNLEQCFGILNGNMRRIALQPARRRTAGGGRGDDEGAAGEVPERAAANDLAVMATLMPTPRSLHDLWQEYHHDVGGRKAARLFSYSERGRSKHRYHHQKVVWDLVG
ncbi:hypothetical protein MHU86_4506 [Fragilaria crotonensis]|nr:hypothetical protein MHU86_4506 [Fragilaria crotonensis]